jgi:hypothetical protein
MKKKPRKRKAPAKRSTNKPARTRAQKKKRTPAKRSKPAADPDAVTLKRFADIFGLTQRRVRELRADGILPGPARSPLPLAASAQAYVRYKEETARGDELQASRLKLSEIKARAAEVDLLERMGALAYVEDLQEALDELAGKARKEAASIGKSICYELVGEKDPATIAGVVDAAVERAIRFLSELEAGPAAAPRRARKVNGHRVVR